MTLSNLHLKSQLDARELLMLESEVKSQGKSMLVAYLLWYFLGIFGIHRFYLGYKGSAIAQLVLSITVIGLIVTGVWWIVDAFLTHSMVNERNAETEGRVLQEILINKQASTGRF